MCLCLKYSLGNFIIRATVLIVVFWEQWMGPCLFFSRKVKEIVQNCSTSPRQDRIFDSVGSWSWYSGDSITLRPNNFLPSKIGTLLNGWCMVIPQKTSGNWIWNALEPSRAAVPFCATGSWKSCVSEASSQLHLVAGVLLRACSVEWADFSSVL